MSNKVLANMKSIFDAGSDKTVLMNKVLGRKYEHFYEMTNGLEEILEAEKKRLNIESDENEEQSKDDLESNESEVVEDGDDDNADE